MNNILKRCSKCTHYYLEMVGSEGKGYNPAPFCHKFEDTGIRPNILTGECFKNKKNKNNLKGE